MSTNPLDGLPDLAGRRIAVPGGTGGVGEGVVRAALAAGAEVVVPTRTPARAEEFRRALGEAASGAAADRLHVVVHDYTTFAGAEQFAEHMVRNLGGIDAVVAAIGGWWSGKALWDIGESDWDGAFVALATAHMAVLRACLPRMGADGAYMIMVGESATTPVPGSGLVSMEQAALLMMQQVAQIEAAGRQRVFALVLGPVKTRHVATSETSDASPTAAWVSADHIGAVAVAVASTPPALTGRALPLSDRAQAERTLRELEATLGAPER